MAESNKTEKATPKKRKDERKKGNAFQSKDLVSVVMILVSFVMISKFIVYMSVLLKDFYLQQLVRMENLYELTIAEVMVILKDAALAFCFSALPILLTLALIAFVVTGAQTKFLFSADLLKFKYSRISFLQGIKKMISLRAVVQLIKSLIKVFVILYIIYTSIQELLVVIPDTINNDMAESILFMKDEIMAMVYKICVIFAGVAIFDFSYQKYEYEKKLRMSKQEIKDEYKMTEGDPFIKGKIKEKQRKLSMNRMIQQVQHADVIVRNPTHYAVALKYDLDKDPAPIVLAKGQDLMAKRIIAEAEKHHVLITENKPLARSLYESVELNQYIPVELYQLVAEVMAWVFKTRKKEQGLS
ncbi:MAG: flagellar biosynthesis protein FlhB [Eubacteriales bacterium]|nr:flagellar biosynthesis protein FlhB [Eubacteriales bacterium]MDD3349969.1 flagellar biosynthesis protein FlhB [Eubacteriales bacterium]